jgi:hypothetical protein
MRSRFCNRTPCSGAGESWITVTGSGGAKLAGTISNIIVRKYMAPVWRDIVLPQWRPVPLLEDVALLAKRPRGGIASGHCEEGVIKKARDGQWLCNNGYATGSGALSRRSHLFESRSSRLRHQRMHGPVPTYSEVIFDVAAGRHKLSDTDSSLGADHDRHGVAGGCMSLYLCSGCPAEELITR